jgi:hypothetical protein
MPIPECPICHRRASLAGQQPYCPKCGWNRDVAIAALRHNMKMLPAGVVLFSAFILFLIYAWHFRSPMQLAIFVAVPAIGLSINYFVVKNRLARLARVQTESGSFRNTAASGGSEGFSSGGLTRDVGTIQPDPGYQALVSVPRPRQIRMAKRGRINLAVGVIVVAFFAGILGFQVYASFTRARSFAMFGPKDWLMAGLVVLLLLIPYGMWRAQVRECDLLQNGEIAEGRVTRQWLNKNTSSIAYEFTDFMGNKHTGLGSDYTNKLYQGMAVPVFYDSNKPKRQIAYCSTFHEIIV